MSLRVRDIRLTDVLAGKNWRVVAEQIDDHEDMTTWPIEECAEFGETDTVLYSAISVTTSDCVIPVLVAREVGSAEWWGDFCEFVDGRWQLPGHDPDAEDSQEFVANPLPNDPSFAGDDEPEEQREGFRRWRSKIALGTA